MLLLKEVPKYECLLERSRRYPELDPSAMEAFLHLMRTSTDLTEAFGVLHASHNISHGRFIVLMLLNRAPEKPVNPADLADRADVTRATMTGLIDRLERDGLVRREPTPDDRRMMLVRLTVKGRRYFERILPDYFRRVATVMRRLTQAERRTLVGLMAKIAEAIPDASAGAPGQRADS